MKLFFFSCYLDFEASVLNLYNCFDKLYDVKKTKKTPPNIILFSFVDNENKYFYFI